MKYRIFRIAIAALMLTGFCAFKTHAGPANVQGILADAYTALDRADHDYKGHRVAAMKQIEAAAKELNLNLGGDGKGHEKQGVSDEQLRTAEGLLSQAKGELKEEKHKKALHHVNKALEDLHTALKIK